MNTHKLILFISILLAFSSNGSATVISGPNFSYPVIHVGGAGGTATSASFSQKIALGLSAGRSVVTGTTLTMIGGFFFDSSAPQPPASNITIIDPTIDNKLFITGPGGLITVCIFAGTFSEPITITLNATPTFSPLTSNVAVLNGTGIGVDIAASPTVKPKKPMVITITYRDSDIQNLQESRLRTSRHINAEGRWVPLTTTVDSLNNTVTFRSFDFGTYQVTEMAPSSNVNSVFSFPNPFRPSLGHTELRMTNLPANSSVLILTIRGDKIREVVADASGQATWDGKNKDGRSVTSGIYVALIRDGSSTKTIKLAVER